MRDELERLRLAYIGLYLATATMVVSVVLLIAVIVYAVIRL